MPVQIDAEPAPEAKPAPADRGPGPRSLFSVMLARERPRPLPGAGGPLREIAPGVWSLDRALRMRSGIREPVRMTVVQLAGGDLWVHSPLWLEPDTVPALASLGVVRFVVAPTTYHHLWAREFADRFPGSIVCAAPGLREAQPQLSVDLVLGEDAEVPWGRELEHTVVRTGFDFVEVPFLHGATATLILADLAMNICAETGLQRLFWTLNGTYRRFGPSRLARLLQFRRHEPMRPGLRRVLDWEFDRIVMCHGDVIPSGGRALFERAFAAMLNE